MKILVAYDGTLNSKTALKYGIQKVRESSGEIIVLHVFNSGLFVGYDASPRAEMTARIESARYVEDATRILEGSAGSVSSRIIVEEGIPAEEILRFAVSEKVDMILAPPAYKSIVKTAPCPVSIVPGYLLLPLDSTDVPAATIERVVKEVKATDSKVLLTGILPVHLYNKWEKEEMKKVEKETSAQMKHVKKLLDELHIESRELMRKGYPDEEIVKVANEYPISIIIMPAGGNEPSELSKAAAILSIEDPETINKPLVLLHGTS